MLLSVEPCSPTLEHDGMFVTNLVASGLFGDGAAAVMLADVKPGPADLEIVVSPSALSPGTEEVMNGRAGASGFQVGLSTEAPDMARRHLPESRARVGRPGVCSEPELVRW